MKLFSKSKVNYKKEERKELSAQIRRMGKQLIILKCKEDQNPCEGRNEDCETFQKDRSACFDCGLFVNNIV